MKHFCSSIMWILMFLTLAGCGDENNVVPGGPGGPGGPPPVGGGGPTGPNPTFNPNVLLGRFPCQAGGAQRFMFYFQLPVNVPIGQLNNPAFGQLQNFQGHNQPFQGNLERVFVGIHPPYNDLLIVSDYSQGNAIVMREIMVGICPYPGLIFGNPNQPHRYEVHLQQVTTVLDPNCVAGQARGSITLVGRPTPVLSAFALPQSFAGISECVLPR